MKKQAAVLFNKPWKHVVGAMLALLLAYALASWGIDSGRLTAYFGAAVFGLLGVSHAIKAIKGYARQN